MALCLVLLLAATLCLRSLFNARTFDPGFEVKGRVAAEFNLRDFGYTTAQAKEFYTRLISQVQTQPGVQSAGLTWHLPLGTERMTFSDWIIGILSVIALSVPLRERLGFNYSAVRRLPTE